jgi:RNA-directed DNA polymerase
MGMSEFHKGIPSRRTLWGQKPSVHDPKTEDRSPASTSEESREGRSVKAEKAMERVYERRRLETAWQQVRKNAGAAGIDKVTVEAFERQAARNLEFVREKLKAGTYRFKPSRRVEIPKPGSTKKRKLGIPIVMDRVVSQSMNLVLEEILGTKFTKSNFGFQRGKSQHQAIGRMRQIIAEGYGWCASIDLKSFFDEILHGLILKLVRRNIRDEKFLTLIARALKAGVMTETGLVKSDKGTPQGSPLSPILSNLVLNELDQRLEARGHKYVRWADDFLIFLKTERAARRVMESTTEYLEKELELPVNAEKSQVGRSHEMVFLGFQILRGKIRVSGKARTKFKEKVKGLTKRNNPLSMYQIIRELNESLRGWMAYFGVQEFHRPIKELDWFVRSRLRSMQLKKWKKPKKLQREMIRQGWDPEKARSTWVKMNKWQSAKRRTVEFILNEKWFRRMGLIFLEDFTQRTLELKFSH